jgi:multidrug efflux pump subunit AcrA (membrane-fusion protein)
MPDWRTFSFARRVLPLIAVAGLVLAAVFIFSGLPDRSTSPPVRTPAKAPATLAAATRVAGSGVVEPSSEVIDIGAPLSGLVTAVAVTPGDYVSPGQPLFSIDDRAVRAQLREAVAAIGEARAAIGEARTAKATATRQLALYRAVDDADAVSRSEVIRAEGEAAAAEQRVVLARARLDAAEARAASARTELGRLTVRAPVAGEILAVAIRPGEYVSTMGASSQAFIQMGQTRPLHVRIDIDEEQAPRVRLGAAAVVAPRGAGGRQVEARFVRAEPLIVPKRSLTNSAQERVDVRVLQLIYALPDSKGLFRVGQQVDAYIPALSEGGR